MKDAKISSNCLREHRNNRPHDDIEHIEITFDLKVAMKIEEQVTIRAILDIGEKIKQLKIRTVIYIVKIKRRNADGVVKHNAAVDPNYDKQER